MKIFIKQLVLSGAFLMFFAFINAQIEDSYTGEWKFEAPDAPEGSQRGNVLFKANTVIMTFDSILQFPSEWVKAPKDSIIYEIAFDDTNVRFSLKIKDANNMTGKAVWDEGETPVFLTRKIVGVKL